MALWEQFLRIKREQETKYEDFCLEKKVTFGQWRNVTMKERPDSQQLERGERQSGAGTERSQKWTQFTCTREDRK